MSIPSVLSSHSTYQPGSVQSNFKQVPKDFSDLANAIQAGDLAAIGKALQSGDENSAKDALTKLQQDMQAAAKGHHHHPHRAEGANFAASSSTGSTTTAATDGDGDKDGSRAQALNITA